MKTKSNFGQQNKGAGQAYRYQLSRVAGGILAVKGKDWKEQHRTCWCSRSIRNGDQGTGKGGFVEVYRNEARDGASLAGVTRCGNLHTCPVCAAKANELRRRQLSAAMVTHQANKGMAYLVTGTFPHEAGEPLAKQLPKFIKARSAFLASRKWRDFRKQKRMVGFVMSLEFTVSLENGWHPHFHMLVFCDKNAFGEGAPDQQGELDSTLIAELKKLWCEHLFKVGLGNSSKLKDMLKHALSIRGGEKAAEYIAKFGRDEKWGASSELARAHAKIGAAGERWGVMHFAPFQLLAWAEHGDTWAVHRFREYAEAVEGKKALYWSKGLKAALKVLDVDEDEWATNDDTPQPDQIQVGSLDAEQYSVIWSRKCLPEFLEYVASCCENQEHLDEWIDHRRTLNKVASGALLIKLKVGRKMVNYA